MVSCEARERVRRGEVEVDHPGKRLRRSAQRRTRRPRAGVVDQPVDAPMPLDYGVHQPFTVGFAGHITGHHVGPGNLGLQRPQPLGAPGRQDRNRPAGGQRAGQLLAQAGTRAGHDDHATG